MDAITILKPKAKSEKDVINEIKRKNGLTRIKILSEKQIDFLQNIKKGCFHKEDEMMTFE